MTSVSALRGAQIAPSVSSNLTARSSIDLRISSSASLVSDRWQNDSLGIRARRAVCADDTAGTGLVSPVIEDTLARRRVLKDPGCVSESTRLTVPQGGALLLNHRCTVSSSFPLRVLHSSRRGLAGLSGD